MIRCRAAPVHRSRWAALRARTLFHTVDDLRFVPTSAAAKHRASRQSGFARTLGFSPLEMGFVAGRREARPTPWGQLVNRAAHRAGSACGASSVPGCWARVPRRSCLRPPRRFRRRSRGGALGRNPPAGSPRPFHLDVAAGGPLAVMLLLAFVNGWFSGRGLAAVRQGGRQLVSGSSSGAKNDGDPRHELHRRLGCRDLRGWGDASSQRRRLADSLHRAGPSSSPRPSCTCSGLHEYPPAPVGSSLEPHASPADSSADRRGAWSRPSATRRSGSSAWASSGSTPCGTGFWIGRRATSQRSTRLDALSVGAQDGRLPPRGARWGTLSSGWLTDRFFDSRRAPVCALLLGGVGALTLAYRVVVGMGYGPHRHLSGARRPSVCTARRFSSSERQRRTSPVAERPPQRPASVDFTGHVGAFSGDVVTGWMV